MFRQACTIEPSFFETTSGMHHRPFECRHLINDYYPVKLLIMHLLFYQSNKQFSFSLWIHHCPFECRHHLNDHYPVNHPFIILPA